MGSGEAGSLKGEGSGVKGGSKQSLPGRAEPRETEWDSAKWKTKLVKYSMLRPAKAWISMCRFGGLGQGNKQRIQRLGIRPMRILCICSY